MSDISTLTAWFKAQIGTGESPPGSNNVKYNTDYYGHPVSGDAYPWCCAFIWDGYRLCGLSKLFCGGVQTAYCPFVVNYAKGHGQWITTSYKEGDLLLYDWDKDGVADHIGYCSGVSGSNVFSIEGNWSDKVQMVTRYFGSIMGALRPPYSSAGNNENSEPKQSAQQATTEAKTVKVELPVLSKGCKGSYVTAMQDLLIANGFRCGPWGADGDFGNGTYDALLRYQKRKKLAIDGVCGAESWKKLLGGE